MRRVFLDTSALVKLYRNEPNSALVRGCLFTGDDLLISELTPLEFDAACLAWVRQGLVDEADARGRMSAFAADLSNYTMVEIRRATWARARTLLDQFAVSEGLRAPDALQAAAALDEHARTPIEMSRVQNDALRRGVPVVADRDSSQRSSSRQQFQRRDATDLDAIEDKGDCV